jgi:endonuclease/exonuclease/phosphatase family metal-dependent hydrolase
MRVMTYNMLHAPGDRLESLLEVVREAEPDVLACQEIDDIAGLLALSRQLEMPAAIGHANQPESPPHPEHVAILSRWPIEQVHVHRGDLEAMFRPVLEVWVAPPDGGLVGFFTVHFRARPGAPGSEVKQCEARHLADVLARATGRFCALGDFNAWAPGEGELSAGRHANLAEDHRAAVCGGVIDALLALNLTDTWKQCHPAPEPVAPTLRDSATSRVDYILASRDLAPSVRTSDVIQSASTAIASDHYPLLTTFTLVEQ